MPKIIIGDNINTLMKEKQKQISHTQFLLPILYQTLHNNVYLIYLNNMETKGLPFKTCERKDCSL